MDKIFTKQNSELDVDLSVSKSENLEIRINENSCLKTFALNGFGKLRDLKISCGKNTNFTLNFLIKSETNLDLSILLAGENSSANIKGAYILDNCNITINTHQNHLARSTTSSLDIRGLLRNTSKSIYNGKIFIDKIAQFSNATLYNKNILLSEEANAISIPSLEVLTEDVKCSHGSAIGPLDKEQLNYLMARGISPKEAESLLLEAFLS
ncbi:hypothetical protein A3F66_02240 [candidate division TM6 bacterium RIFCSPHIGHO2_12_FULL_32_22]|nr:MAG: hypothetical protein A3F66_02240 [candidate division TM6 bacterium RIFCSPHIGHO2_12_FULL_32_22]